MKIKMKKNQSKSFYKLFFVIELFFLLIFLSNVFSAFPNNKKENILEVAESFQKVTFGKKINIYLSGKDSDLLISNRLASYANYEKLKELKKEDRIYALFRKNKTFQEWANGVLGHQEIIGLRSDRNGKILDFSKYAQSEEKIGRIIFKSIVVPILILLSLCIGYGWILSILIIINPVKYVNFSNHILVQYKINKE